MQSEAKIQNVLFQWLFELDRILRGEATKPIDIRRADIEIPVVGVAFLVMSLAVIYGFCMGIFAIVCGMEGTALSNGYMQTFATMCKVPLLYGLTLLITFPSLYVFNALVGSQLRFFPVLKLLVASLAVNLSVLASLGPIVAFFSLSTPNYGFIVLLNVTVFGVAGILGLAFLVQTLKRLTAARCGSLSVHQSTQSSGMSGVSDPVSVATGPAVTLPSAKPPPRESQIAAASVADRPGPLEEVTGLVVGKHIWKVFAVWILVFGLVGAQMGWVLRPFIGSPDKEFTWFRARESNFFASVFDQIVNLIF